MAARDASKERHEVVSSLILLVLEGNGARAVADRERLRSVQPEACVVASTNHSAPRAGREALQVVANQRPVLCLGAVRQGNDGVLACKDGEARDVVACVKTKGPMARARYEFRFHTGRGGPRGPQSPSARPRASPGLARRTPDPRLCPQRPGSRRPSAGVDLVLWGRVAAAATTRRFRGGGSRRRRG